MLYLRALLFSVLVPGAVGVWIPGELHGWREAGEWWARMGYAPIVTGAAFYLLSLAKFVEAGGTPSIYVTRPLRWVLGEEPKPLVEHGLYHLTRNPMYVGVITAVFGQAMVFGSAATFGYGLVLCGWFHLVVTWLEEPHLRRVHGAEYEAYCSRVPRWLLI